MAKKKPPDGKTLALRKQGSLHPYPEKVSDPLFQQGAFFDRRDIVQVKYEMLRRVRTEGETVLRCAAAFGLSRQSFYQTLAAFTREGLSGLLHRKPGPHGAHKLTVEVAQFVAECRAQQPSVRSAELAERVQERFGVTVHPRTLERALLRQQKKGRQ
jgi:transposase